MNELEDLKNEIIGTFKSQILGNELEGVGLLDSEEKIIKAVFGGKEKTLAEYFAKFKSPEDLRGFLDKMRKQVTPHLTGSATAAAPAAAPAAPAAAPKGAGIPGWKDEWTGYNGMDAYWNAIEADPATYGPKKGAQKPGTRLPPEQALARGELIKRLEAEGKIPPEGLKKKYSAAKKKERAAARAAKKAGATGTAPKAAAAPAAGEAAPAPQRASTRRTGNTSRKVPGFREFTAQNPELFGTGRKKSLVATPVQKANRTALANWINAGKNPADFVVNGVRINAPAGWTFTPGGAPAAPATTPPAAPTAGGAPAPAGGAPAPTTAPTGGGAVPPGGVPPVPPPGPAPAGGTPPPGGGTPPAGGTTRTRRTASQRAVRRRQLIQAFRDARGGVRGGLATAGRGAMGFLGPAFALYGAYELASALKGMTIDKGDEQRLRVLEAFGNVSGGMNQDAQMRTALAQQQQMLALAQIQRQRELDDLSRSYLQNQNMDSLVRSNEGLLRAIAMPSSPSIAEMMARS